MESEGQLRVNLSSFGFKYGTPHDIQFVWDVRFLPNPYWVEELRSKNGLNREVSDYVVGSLDGAGFLKYLRPLLLYIIQQNIKAEKAEMNLAVGCTGGRHRSVAIVEAMKDMVVALPVLLDVHHRDIEKD